MTAPTTRADHAELVNIASAFEDGRITDGRLVEVLLNERSALLSEIAALRGEVDRSLPSISLDGEHAISDHRRWLARQLLDSRLDDGEAYSVVAYHPAITDLRTTQAERQRDEAVGLLRVANAAMANITAFDDEIWSVIGSTNLSILKANQTAIRAFLANQGADQ